MCLPVVMVAMAVASMAMAAKSANDNKHAVEAQARAQQDQINQQASAQTEDRLNAARQARASARAAAAEAGASGNSTAAQLNDFMQQSATDVARIEKNRLNGTAESQIAAKSRFSEINGQLTQSLASSAMQATSAGMSYFGGNQPKSDAGSATADRSKFAIKGCPPPASPTPRTDTPRSPSPEGDGRLCPRHTQTAQPSRTQTQ